jgi:PKD repeat protein
VSISLRERYLATFDGTLSTDADGSIVDFAWDFGDGATARGASLSTGRHAYAVAGTYRVSLTVTDNSGLSHSLAQSVFISPNLALRIAAGQKHTLVLQSGRLRAFGLWMQGYSDDYLDPAIHYYADCRGHVVGSREINDPPGPLQREFSRGLSSVSGVGVIAAGHAFSVMTLTGADTAWSWGINFGNLGNGQWRPHRARPWVVAPRGVPRNGAPLPGETLVDPARPQYVYKDRDDKDVVVQELDVVTSFTDIVQLAAGNQHVIALKRDGSVWAWGRADFGALGVGITRADYPPDAGTPYAGMPKQIEALTTRAVAVAAGSNVSLVLDEEGHVWEAGSFDPAQIPRFGANPELATMVRRTDLDNVVAIAAGSYQGLALRADGTVWQWGFLVADPPNNDWVRTPTAHQVPLLSNVVAISAGRGFAHAVRADGTLWGWGQSNVLGDGGAFGDNHETPLRIATDIQSVVDGQGHAIAIQNDGFLLGWGSNASCQLGVADHEEEVLGYIGADAAAAFLPNSMRYFGRPVALGVGL